jgi:hypothetical protein
LILRLPLVFETICRRRSRRTTSRVSPTTSPDATLHGDAMNEWHQQRNVVMNTANNLAPQLDYLRKSGLWQGSGYTPKGFSLSDLSAVSNRSGVQGTYDAKGLWGKAQVGADLSGPQYRVAREYLEYEKRLNAHSAPDSTDFSGIEGKKWLVWQDGQDKEINIDGVKFPSPVRLKWADQMLQGTKNDPDYEQKRIASMSVQGWDTLSTFEKEIVGKKVNPSVSQGWLIYQAITDGYRGNVSAKDVAGVKVKGGDLSELVPKALPQGQREIDKAWKIKLAKYVNNNFADGFYKDFLYSTEPKYRRVSVLPVVTQSPAKKEWFDLLKTANVEYGYIAAARDAYARNRDPGYTITSVQDGWDDYAKHTLYPYFEESGSADFKKELEMLGGVDFLRTLIAD